MTKASQSVAKSRAKALESGAERIEAILRDPVAVAIWRDLVDTHGTKVAALTHLLKSQARAADTATENEMTDLINNLARQEVNGEISLSRAIDAAMSAGMDYEVAAAAILAAGQAFVQEARQ